jgi:signal transduction histidine kinase
VAQLGLTALRGEELQPIFDEAVALVARALNVEHAMILEARTALGVLEFRAGVGPLREELIRRATVPMAPGFLPWFSMKAKAPAVIEDLKTVETRFVPSELLIQHGVKSAINVPICGGDRPFGVLCAHSTRSRSFSEDEAQFVWSMANVLYTSIEQKRASSELREKREKLQALSRQLIEAQEAERRAIARELHDDFGQILTALKLNLTRGGRDQSESIEMVDGALARMRDLAHDLRPPMLDELGLVPSLRWYLEREARRAGLAVHLDLAEPEVQVPPSIATACFRVAQEAVTNVIRHAQAHRIDVALGVEKGALQLVVRDDGRGFDVAEANRRARRGASQGLLNMQERAALAGGDLTIESPGGGTTLRARFPLCGAG